MYTTEVREQIYDMTTRPDALNYYNPSALLFTLRGQSFAGYFVSKTGPCVKEGVRFGTTMSHLVQSTTTMH